MRIPFSLLLGLWLALASACGTNPLEELLGSDPPPAGTPPGGPASPPVGDPFAADRIVLVGTSDNDQDGDPGLLIQTWNNARYSLHDRLPVRNHIEDLVLSPGDLREIAIHAHDRDAGTEAVYAGPLGTDGVQEVSPRGLTRIGDLIFSADGRWLAFTGIESGTRRFWTQDRSTTMPAQAVSEAQVGVWRTDLGFVYRIGNELHLWRWGAPVGQTEMLSLAGDPSAFARVAVTRDGKTLLYSQGELFHIDVSGLDPGPPVQVSTETGTTGEVRGDQVRFGGSGRFVLYPREMPSGLTGLVFADLQTPGSAEVVSPAAMIEDVFDYGFQRRGDGFWLKIGFGQVWVGTAQAPTQVRLIVDTDFVSGPRISHDGNWIGFSAGLSRPTLTVFSVNGGAPLELPDIDGHASWDFLKGTLPNGPPDTPIAWGAETGGNLVLKTGTIVGLNGLPTFQPHLDHDFPDWGHFRSVKFKYSRWLPGADPTTALIVEQRFHDLDFVAFGTDQNGEFFTPRLLGYRADVKYLGFTTRAQLPPELTVAAPGTQALTRNLYTGFGSETGKSYEKNSAIIVGGDGAAQLFEWADGPFAILQTSIGNLRLDLLRMDLDEEGTDGAYEFTAPGGTGITTANDFLRRATQNAYLLDGSDPDHGYRVTLTFPFD